MTTIDIIRTGHCIRFLTGADCGATAELDVEQLDNVLVIKHTRIDQAFKGQGIGMKLLSECVLEARAKGLQIIPECSYAAYQFEKNPRWSELVADTSTSSA